MLCRLPFIKSKENYCSTKVFILRSTILGLQLLFACLPAGRFRVLRPPTSSDPVRSFL